MLQRYEKFFCSAKRKENFEKFEWFEWLRVCLEVFEYYRAGGKGLLHVDDALVGASSEA